MTLANAFDAKPAVLVFADYTCRTLCGPILDFATTALQNGARPGSDYRLVVIGMIRRMARHRARAMRARISASGPVARPRFS